ncbi:type II secretion system protein J [Flavobacterium sp. H122]|uniref:PulJ/GspJ family protein n=1 Tax=Flavobacterium sp. H122 TaxID=2529860 RepID=UPI0010A9E0F3|nr:prepilin-type N-terminal cleavage/methylation domain-containing protein [Flavobacterium sp. H122]
MPTKLKSFTLSELLVVMIITAIVVGMAFSVLRLVQNQINIIRGNYEKSTKLSLFEQRLWQDFNEFNQITFNKKKSQLLFQSELDSIQYAFEPDFVLRNKDTIKLKLNIDHIQFEGEKVSEGDIDAIAISGESELPKYKIFVSKKNDITQKMNEEDDIQIR